ncbi:hypothetical protein EN836_07640 [Mesorhizobium sp. M1C.F.Ca.ET.193.01.1.1]|uniref:hypothetical protein n=1 Tax=unclassified Mesorhizobium TaxID=325217 RepID=UPI000FD2D5A0|nr:MULTISPECIES: hypothetical protein [unclassified Mesorhizobium]TGT02465.1 hypothetical protein EN820_25460 [bacterium M00.F.Ca.ET.177.01.1.1]RWG90775.1 MAG: hypothetical protein EOQ70_03495 [Mesorhizobium sp.]RWK10602.1 MAG: hypothetical protein EOR39_13915 [Mesorhizobium sp.]RWK21280.1 MAG: hypothetical protein EOR41_04855 [Mesorhizobium sp.]RWK24774.1 MAG: hypothetical protein EOR43_06610 [Mesorhizobium sp.]
MTEIGLKNREKQAETIVRIFGDPAQGIITLTDQNVFPEPSNSSRFVDLGQDVLPGEADSARMGRASVSGMGAFMTTNRHCR